MYLTIAVTIIMMVQFYLFPAPPFSVDNVLVVVEPLPWSEVGRLMSVPFSKFEIIDNDYTTDKEKLGAVIRYWLLRDPYASWRMLIQRLYIFGKYETANKIQNYAEKLTGQ